MKSLKQPIWGSKRRHLMTQQASNKGQKEAENTKEKGVEKQTCGQFGPKCVYMTFRQRRHIGKNVTF